MYKFFVKLDRYAYRLFSEADTLENLEIPLASQFNPWKIEKDGEVVDQSQPDDYAKDFSNTTERLG